ncbi:MAG: STAS domain-containing protein, partial [Abitibacteriaceae bacterium]|nr:STAS domain-containing protein [Abditibacteriaceae bacterium]
CGVTYIHSTGYGLLLTVQRQAQAAGGKLVVAGFSSKVGSIFQLLGFDRVIPSFPTVEEALQSFR